MQATVPTKRPFRAAHVRWISIALIVISLMVVMRMLPIDQGFELLRTRIDRLGMWAPVVFGLVYIVAALLFVPGSALTLMAGAVFGLWLGTATVSVASTVAAAFGFLIARYLARDAVARRARANPKFRAIDEAIRQGDWRIIGMLRLSPAIPYSLSNYLYGLTPVRFWPYVAASWIAMLPGTFMYVYIGHLGATGLSAAAQTDGGRGTGQWALLVVGLLATVAVTVYVTSLARKAIAAQTSIDAAPEAAAAPATDAAQPERAGLPWGTVLAAGLALCMTTAAGAAYLKRDAVQRLFKPPAVELREAYAGTEGTATFDHTAFDALLHQYVDADGWVDYAGMRDEAATLDQYLAALTAAPFGELGRDEKLALLVNAYNAFTLRLILDHYPVASIKDIPGGQRWDDVRWQVGPHVWSLNQIEHEQVRAHFSDPRVHFALNCASVGCPPLRSEAYTAARLEAQLDAQARAVHAGDRWLRFQPGSGVVELTRLYDWYAGDFEQAAGSVLDYAARYAPALRAALDDGVRPVVRWLPYSWSLNIPPPASATQG